MSDRISQIVATTLRARYTDVGRLEVLPQEVPSTAAEQAVIAPADLQWLIATARSVRTAHEALGAITRERNTWARQLADANDEKRTAEDRYEQERLARSKVENGVLAAVVELGDLAMDPAMPIHLSDRLQAIVEDRL